MLLKSCYAKQRAEVVCLHPEMQHESTLQAVLAKKDPIIAPIEERFAKRCPPTATVGDRGSVGGHNLNASKVVVVVYENDVEKFTTTVTGKKVAEHPEKCGHETVGSHFRPVEYVKIVDRVNAVDYAIESPRNGQADEAESPHMVPALLSAQIFERTKSSLSLNSGVGEDEDVQPTNHDFLFEVAPNCTALKPTTSTTNRGAAELHVLEQGVWCMVTESVIDNVDQTTLDSLSTHNRVRQEKTINETNETALGVNVSQRRPLVESRPHLRKS